MEEFNKEEFLQSNIAKGEDAEPWAFPELGTLSPAFFYQFTPVAKMPSTPEIVIVPKVKAEGVALVGMLASWNQLWEAAQYRKEATSRDGFRSDYPDFAKWVDNLPQANIYLFPETKSMYDVYGPLYHVLPKRILDRHGIPALMRSIWPNNGVGWNDEIMPPDFAQRLSNAFAEHVWHHIDTGSGINAFSRSDPLRLLSHSLDFWIPSAIMAIERRMRWFDRVEPETPKQKKFLAKARKLDDPDVLVDRPRKGGTLWMGEEEAADVTAEIVDIADRNGKLRSIIEAVKSNRVVDDFSPCWSFAREDFERKLYSKRSKVRVSFVELNDTLPVHSRHSEYTDNLLWEDFSAILDSRERHIVVCLRSGTTKLGDIASSLGYPNHSPVSKALVRIRKKAKAFLDAS